MIQNLFEVEMYELRINDELELELHFQFHVCMGTEPCLQAKIGLQNIDYLSENHVEHSRKLILTMF